MNRSSLLAVASLIAGFIGIGCEYCMLTYEPTPIELGIDVDLHDVDLVRTQVGSRDYFHMAVGSEGTVVVWGKSEPYGDADWFVDITHLGDADLHGAWVLRSYEDFAGWPTWWVVGDAGTIARSDDHGTTWEAIELPDVDADLHAITGVEAQPLIVGDEIVLLQLPDGTWTEPPVPEGGWGSLRGVSSNASLTYAVGLDGRVWSSTQPSEAWKAEAVGVQVDLFEVQVNRYSQHDRPEAEVIVVGASGTVLIETVDGWRQVDTGVSADLIDIAEWRIFLASDGSIYELDFDDQLTLLESRPGARALSTEYFGHTTVGVGGHAVSPAVGEDC